MISKYETTTRTAGAGGGYFDAFAGLDTTLTGNLQKRECKQSEDRGRRDFPAIVGWYAPGSSDGARSYIETFCKVPTLNERLEARYYHNDQGAGATPNNVVNVLGVPIAAIYLENDRPLANKPANISSEPIDYLRDFDGKLYLDAPRARHFGRGFSNSGVLSPTPLSKLPNGYFELPTFQTIWVQVPSADPKRWFVAKIKAEEYGGSINFWTYLSCETVPCRVNPNDNNLGLWLEGESNGLKLDLVQTKQVVAGGKLLRLETR
ncbi:hypothetical protein MCEGE14_01360 [Burkholderiaceae bacterium]